MRLYRVEVRRALTRRSIRVLAAVMLINLAIAAVVVFLRHDTDEGAARKLLAAAEADQACLDGTLFPPGSVVTEPHLVQSFGDIAPELSEDPPHFRSSFCGTHREALERQVRRFELAQTADVAESLQAILILAALVLGASLIGAEWSANTIATHLTWEPRRLRTYAAKALAALTVGAALVVVVDWLMVATLYPSALLRGSEAVPTGFWTELAGLIARGAAGAAVAAGIGFVIASTTRSTVFAMAFTFLLFLLDSLIVNRIALDMRRWSLFTNLAGYINGRGVDAVVIEDVLVPGRSPGGSGMLVACYVVGALAAGAGLFARRDVQ